jgi:TrmH family RNA methyltransferase
MISTSEIKFIKSLEVKKYRHNNRLFVVEGEKLINELIDSEYTIHNFFCTDDYTNNLNYSNFRVVSQKELERISFLKTPNKVLAVVEMPQNDFSLDKISIGKNSLLLGLDGISDPGNMGTILRIANWYGIETIVCSDDCVDCYSPKVVQASMGALFRTQIYIGDLAQYIMQLKQEKNVPVYSSELGGKSVYDSTISTNALLLLGSESHGIRPEISDLADHKVLIPSFPEGNQAMESLNVGVAAGILCAEFRRRQG